jgi:hypothetical protein
MNNREPLFWSSLERARFKRVLNEARKLHVFALYGLRFSGPTVSFFIKPADGFQLPEIMQLLKQTFAVRYNVMKRLDEHVWGDRYWSKVLEGESPVEEAGRGDCGEERAVEGGAGGRIPEARPWEGPPNGDSHQLPVTPAPRLPPPGARPANPNITVKATKKRTKNDPPKPIGTIPDLPPGKTWNLEARTQYTYSETLLKDVRTIKAGFTLAT